MLYDLFPKGFNLSIRIIINRDSKALKGIPCWQKKKVYNLYALSFEEFVRFRSEEEYQRFAKLDFQNVSAPLIECIIRIILMIIFYMAATQRWRSLKNKTERIEELQDIYNSYIQKDIKSLIKGEDISAYNNLLKVLASQAGNLLNINELSNTLKIEGGMF